MVTAEGGKFLELLALLTVQSSRHFYQDAGEQIAAVEKRSIDRPGHLPQPRRQATATRKRGAPKRV